MKTMKLNLPRFLVTGMACGVIFVAATSRAESGTAVQAGIVPMPFSVEAKKEVPFEIGAETGIVPVGVGSKAVADYLRNRIAASTGLNLKVRDSGEANTIVLRIDPDAVKFPEKDAYTLESGKDKITITGKSASGLFYGVQTLFQLLPAGIYSDTPAPGMKLSVDAVTIQDKPSMEKIRGLHVDIARHFRTKEELKKIIDAMAMHKLNTLHLHATDNQGWRIEIKAYPKLTTVGAIGNNSNPNAPAAFLTQEEVKEIGAYAAERHISIIPEIDIPGHMGAAIRAYPELKHPKETREKGNLAIRGDAMGRDFAKKVLTEVSALFDPEYLHIGFDEVNYQSPVELYSKAELIDFASEITTFIKESLKKKPIVWDDAFTNGFEDKDTVVHWWRYGKKYWWKKEKFTVDEELNKKQQPFIFSPACWTYFDMMNEGKGGWAGRISPAEMYNWDPFGDMLGVTPETRQLAHGAIACTWSEKIPTMKVFGDRTFPRLASFSERVWRGGKSEDSSILSWTDYRDTVLIPYQLKRYDALGLWYWSKDKPDLLKDLADTRKTL
jgi:hexosaminidase